MTGDLAILDKSNLENLTLGPFTINSEQYARQLVNLSEHLSLRVCGIDKLFMNSFLQFLSGQPSLFTKCWFNWFFDGEY